MRRWNLQRVFEMLVDLHDRSLVTAAIAVVRCYINVSTMTLSLVEVLYHGEQLTREDSNDIPILRPVISLHDKLMSSRNQRQAVVVVERLRYILPERVPGAARGDTPAASVIRVRPQQVTHGSLVRHFLDPVEGPDIVQRVDRRGQAAVQAEYLVIDEGSEREVVEEVGKVLPDVGIAVLAEALVVEAVDLRDLTRLVVAAQDGDPLRVSDLEGDEKRHGLDGVVTTVNVVTFVPCKQRSQGVRA